MEKKILKLPWQCLQNIIQYFCRRLENMILLIREFGFHWLLFSNSLTERSDFLKEKGYGCETATAVHRPLDARNQAD